MLKPYLIIYQDLHGVVAPLDQDKLIGLTWNCIGERRSHTGGGIGLQPHAHGQSVHFRQTLLHLCVHVVGPQRKCELEFIKGSVFSLTCQEKKNSAFLSML